MRIEAEEAAAAARVLRRWHAGIRLLTCYAAAATVLMCVAFSFDHQQRDVFTTNSAVMACGVVLLCGVSYRNHRAGKALAHWQPNLASPTKFTGHRGQRPSGCGYLVGLLGAASLALLVQTVAANLSATGRATAEVRSCSRDYRGDTNCDGTWTVAGRAYSGHLPDSSAAWRAEGRADPTVTVRYDPAAPAILGQQSIGPPVLFIALFGLIAGMVGGFWRYRERDPYLTAVKGRYDL